MSPLQPSHRQDLVDGRGDNPVLMTMELVLEVM
jgi:hypothetical protein